VVKALREVGYNDYCIAEMIPYYTYAPETRLVNTSRAMDKIFAM
jgi:L-ribulose-5-phosphate 3-epimerase